MNNDELIKVFKKEFLTKSIKLCNKYECDCSAAGYAFIECALDLLDEKLKDDQKVDVIVKYSSIYLMTKSEKTAPEVVKHLLGLMKK